VEPRTIRAYPCPNPQCPYSGITDAQIHALVGDGKHGQTERIQTFRGPACHTTFTSRRNTPLYRLKTPSHQIAMVLTGLAEGLDPSEARRVAGLSTSHHSHLALPGSPCMRTPCTNASSASCGSRISNWMNCEPDCAALTTCVFLWLVIDPYTKLLPVLHLASPHATCRT